MKLGFREKKILQHLAKRGKRNEDQLLYNIEGHSYVGPSYPVMDSIKSLKRKKLIKRQGEDIRTGLRLYSLTNEGKIAYVDKVVKK